jgi:hypothetical protein
MSWFSLNLPSNPHFHPRLAFFALLWEIENTLEFRSVSLAWLRPYLLRLSGVTEVHNTPRLSLHCCYTI